jgi:NAD(P)H dehydrogenase (quinone)
MKGIIINMKATILFHSISGRSYDLAEAIAAGIRSVEDCTADIYRVQDTYTDEEIRFISPQRERWAHIPEAKWGDLSVIENVDAIVVGGPVYFGQISGPVYEWLQHTAAKPWLAGTLNGVASGAFAACASQNGGAEEAIRNMHTTLLHFGMVVVPFPNSGSVPEMRQHDVPIGGTCYGPSVAAGAGPTFRTIHDMEISLGKKYGVFLAGIAKALKAAR